MSQEIKDAIQDLGNTFAEFKKVNDERLEAVEKDRPLPRWRAAPRHQPSLL